MFLSAVAVVAALSAARAAETAIPLRVGVKEAPPFAMKTAEGAWEGLSVDLWDDLCRRLGVTYEWRERPLDALIGDVAAGELDASIAAITVTAEREEVVDFSHPYFSTGLGVAVARAPSGSLSAAFERVMSSNAPAYAGGFAALLCAVGAAVWLLERRRNEAQFPRAPGQGFWSGVWWASVTMTTVGYGDKAPVTASGRLLAVVWMFSALVLTSLFTAHVTTALTVGRLEGAVTSIDDLPRVRVGVLGGAASEDGVRRLGVRPLTYPSVDSGIAALTKGEIDAFVHDAPILAWVAGTKPSEVLVTTILFELQDYGIVLREASPLREPVNRALLEALGDDDWRAARRRWLGSP